MVETLFGTLLKLCCFNINLCPYSEDLRTILKQYLDGISINEDVINNPANPLIVVNNKLMLAQAARAQQAHQAWLVP